MIIGSPRQGSAGAALRGPGAYSAIASGIASGMASGMASGVSSDCSVSIFIEKRKSENSNEGASSGLATMHLRDDRNVAKDGNVQV